MSRFKLKNFFGHFASTSVGILLSLLICAIMLYFVHVGKATVEGIYPYFTAFAIPVILFFYGKKDDQTPKP